MNYHALGVLPPGIEVLDGGGLTSPRDSGKLRSTLKIHEGGPLPTDQNVIDAVCALIPGGTVVQKLAGDALMTSDARLERGHTRRQLEYVGEDMGKVKEAVEKLVAGLTTRDQPTHDGIRAILEKLDEVSKVTADPSKLELLRNATVNAFDEELYWQGETLVMLDMLKDMTYGDVACLRQIAEHKGGAAEFKAIFTLGDGVQWWGAHRMTRHSKRLEQVGLIVINPPARPAGVDAAAIGWQDGSNNLLVTEYGRLLLKLVRAPNPTGAAAAAE